MSHLRLNDYNGNGRVGGPECENEVVFCTHDHHCPPNASFPAITWQHCVVVIGKTLWGNCEGLGEGLVARVGGVVDSS